MLFDYVMNPLICVIWCSKAALNFVPQVPQPVWLVFFAALFTTLNLRGIKASARTNGLIAGVLGLVILLFFAAAAHFIYQAALPAREFWRPFYDPNTFDFGAVSNGVSLAVLTYIGFDAISTLSEEAVNPRRNIMLATVLTCLVTGLLAAAQVYAGQLIWPDFKTFPDPDTAFVDVARRAGGPILFFVVNLSLLVASIGSGAGAHLAAGRLLYGMGRDNAIPKRFFGALDPKTRIPRYNILLVGALALVGGFLMDYEMGAQLLNFGALIGFHGREPFGFGPMLCPGREEESRRFTPAGGRLFILSSLLFARRLPDAHSGRLVGSGHLRDLRGCAASAAANGPSRSFSRRWRAS